MANVADTKLYDILGVSPTATENELKKVTFQLSCSQTDKLSAMLKYIAVMLDANQEAMEIS